MTVLSIFYITQYFAVNKGSRDLLRKAEKFAVYRGKLRISQFRTIVCLGIVKQYYAILTIRI